MNDFFRPDGQSEDVYPLVERHCPGWALAGDALWVRAGMDRLPAGLRAGWKLHVSGVPSRYDALLEAALPVLCALGLPFKTLRSAVLLERMNDGRFGLGQVGKALTVYPSDEAAAHAAALALAEALCGFEGPWIPSDARFSGEAPVYFRYGPFDARYQVDALGRESRLMAHPEAGDVIDPADGGSTAPPLPALFPTPMPQDHLAFLRERYFFVQVLQLSAKGGAFLAVDRQNPTGPPFVIKTAKPHTHSDLLGRDAVWALEREHETLQLLAGVPGIPEPGVLRRDSSGTLALVRPYIEGERWWDGWICPDARTPAGRGPLERALAQVEALVSECHARGVLVRDLSPGNVLLDEQGTAHVLDFELAHRMEETGPGYRRGTLGFFDPAVDRFQTPGVNDDLFALNALKRMAQSGVHPAWCVDGQEPIIVPGAPVPPPDWGVFWETLPGRVAQFMRQGHRVDELNLYSGISGVLHVAMEQDSARLRGCLPEAQWVELARKMAAGAERLAAIPGMYFGAPGVALALWEMACALPALGECSATALALWDRVLGRAAESRVPDLCHGWAGFAASALAAQAFRPDARLRTLADEAGRRLLTLAAQAGDGLEWPWPEGPFGTMAGERLHGFAHGTAGVTHTLLELHTHLGGTAYLEAAEGGLQTLRRAARDTGADGSWWPCSEQDLTVWNAWCHGTPGVAKTLARALHAREHAEDQRLLRRALRGIAQANNSGWCLCHGVASRLDAFADAVPVLDEVRSWGDADAALLASLDTHALEQRDCGGEAGAEAGGWMCGAAGVLRTRQRYADALRNVP